LEFRNGVFISYAISVAMQLFPLEEVEIMLGLIHINVPYMDCSNTFISLYDKIAKLCSNGKISISAPFINIGKDVIVKKAKELNLNISDTWSCYDNKDKPCGKCDACIDRKILGVL
jgi:7-cyano-7-deazaguanine synthase